jgi:hypothetical protein
MERVSTKICRGNPGHSTDGVVDVWGRKCSVLWIVVGYVCFNSDSPHSLQLSQSPHSLHSTFGYLLIHSDFIRISFGFNLSLTLFDTLVFNHNAGAGGVAVLDVHHGFTANTIFGPWAHVCARCGHCCQRRYEQQPLQRSIARVVFLFANCLVLDIGLSHCVDDCRELFVVVGGVFRHALERRFFIFAAYGVQTFLSNENNKIGRSGIVRRRCGQSSETMGCRSYVSRQTTIDKARCWLYPHSGCKETCVGWCATRFAEFSFETTKSMAWGCCWCFWKYKTPQRMEHEIKTGGSLCFEKEQMNKEIQCTRYRYLLKNIYCINLVSCIYPSC